MSAAALLTLATSTVLLGLAQPLEAQIIRGRILEDSTRTPVDGATLSLLRESGEPTGRQVRSDGAGRFSIATPGTGRFVIVALRVGFLGMTTPASIALGTGEVVVVELFLGRHEAPLSPITITARTDEDIHAAQTGAGMDRAQMIGVGRNPSSPEQRSAVARGSAGGGALASSGSVAAGCKRGGRPLRRPPRLLHFSQTGQGCVSSHATKFGFPASSSGSGKDRSGP